MPNMGLGRLGDPNLIFKRKFRWTFRVDNVCGGRSIPEFYVKTAARPNITIDDSTEINFLNGRKWLPGKATLEPITVTYNDVAALDNMVLLTWLASVWEFSNPVTLRMGNSVRDYGGTGTLTMLSGCGDPLEQWLYQDMWPQTVNFGELDMADSDVAVIELTLRYSNISYQSFCPVFTPTACCTPCSG